MTDTKTRTQTATVKMIPVQMTILVPVKIDIDVGDIDHAVTEENDMCKFVDLEQLDNAAAITEQLIDAAAKSDQVMDAIVMLKSAVMLHRKKYTDCEAISSWCAGIVPDEKVKFNDC